MELGSFLERAWTGYASITPDAQPIHELLQARGELIQNDHVAFRTFDRPGLGRHELGRIFEAWGYEPQEDLDFPEKKLKATYWLHPSPEMPKIFISEALVDRFSRRLQDWIDSWCQRALQRIGRLSAEALLNAEWDPVRHEDYERFYPESEYAAWTAAFGVRVNHFTVLVNALKTFGSVQELNAFLRSKGFILNESGGAVKGSPSELLEQSSTQARRIMWKFADGSAREIPSCYYEFAKRYPLPGGGLFPGFVPKSADKIFESTSAKALKT